MNELESHLMEDIEKYKVEIRQLKEQLRVSKSDQLSARNTYLGVIHHMDATIEKCLHHIRYGDHNVSKTVQRLLKEEQERIRAFLEV